MKTGTFSNNLFSNKVAENQINKFSRSEFLSTSNKFNNLLKETQDKKDEEEDKFEVKDVHQRYVQERSDEEQSADSGLLSALLQNNLGQVENKLGTPDTELSAEDQNFKRKTLKNLGLKSIENQIADDASKLKLDDSFKLTDDQKLADKLKTQENLKNIDLKDANKLEHQKVAAAKKQLGLNHMDTKSKNEFNLQTKLRSKSIELKNTLGRQKAAKVYEQQQPVDAKKSDQKSLETKDINIENVKRVKIAKPLSINKSSSDTLKNDLLSNNIDFEQKLEKTENTSKNEFSKLMNLQSQFKAEGVEDIVKQAQFLAKDGGGEMKLLLNPKGLGSIQLKVMMEENQLKVEMTTDNADAREIIESSLSDLRKALGENQLDVDSISVDMFDRLSDMVAKQEEESSRQFAQDFLSEFRQDNREFREGVLDFPVVKRRRSQIIEDNKLETQGKNSNRRLDLVA